MRNLKLFGQFFVLMSGILFFTGCQQDETVAPIDERSTTAYSAPSVNFYGLGTANELYSYRSGPPATLISEVPIRGLRDGESMVAIDVRPSTKALYGVSNLSSLYTINPSTGMATPVSTSGLGTSGSSTTFNPLLDGSAVGMDFNPKTDRITLLTDKGQQLTVSPTSGQVIQAAGPSSNVITGVNSIAYSNSTTSTTSGSTMYGVNRTDGKLYRLSSTPTAVGSTGMTMTEDGGGFDISRTGTALGVYNASQKTSTLSSTPPADDPTEEAFRLYNISLRNGQATSMGKVLPMLGVAIQ